MPDAWSRRVRFPRVTVTPSKHRLMSWRASGVLAKLLDAAPRKLATEDEPLALAGAPLSARKMYGRTKGGHVRLTDPEGATVLVVGEGIESTLSVAAALGLPGLAALSLGNLSAPLPVGVRTLFLALDNDEGGDPERVRRQKDAICAAHAVRGVEVRPLLPPAGRDWNDVAAETHGHAGTPVATPPQPIAHGA